MDEEKFRELRAGILLGGRACSQFGLITTRLHCCSRRFLHK